MIKISHTTYVPLGQLERFNTPHHKSNFLNNFYEIIGDALRLMEEGKYDQEKFAGKYPGKGYLKRKDLTKPIRITSQIDPDIWYRVQNILVNLTGEVWPMDRWIDLMTWWFIYAYQKEGNKKKPLELKGRKLDKKQYVKKFNLTFRKYYKNIMGNFESA